MATFRYFSMRVLVVTLAGALAGSVDYAAGVQSFDYEGLVVLPWLGFAVIGVVFALLVLGAAVWMYGDRTKKRRWLNWLAAGGILAGAMPAAFLSGTLPLFLYGSLQQEGYRALQHNQYVYVAIILMYLVPCILWSGALALALSVNFFEEKWVGRMFAVSLAWIGGWVVLSQLFGNVESAMLNRNDSDLVLFIGLEAVSAMLIGYYLEKYGVDEASGSAVSRGGSADGDGVNAEV